ncbi:MAG TPA: type IV secretion system protein [Solirubrobacteraceae bacterium]|nr:type IV secretion system protein [Solirubrobacteraceae bacterium]
MNAFNSPRVLIAALLAILIAPMAHAQFAVIDAASIVQLVRQVATMEQQLTTLESQLRQAQAQYQAITGDRGMQNLLSGVNRNYLPTDWASLMAAVNHTGSTYPALSASIQGNIQTNAVLSASQVASLSAAEQAQLVSDRQTASLLEATVQQALSTTSARFASLQQLIAAIGTTADAKASLDLQTRIAAEQAMLQNDQSKLQVLYQAAQAQAWVQQERVREQAIAGIGSMRDLPAMGL